MTSSYYKTKLDTLNLRLVPLLQERSQLERDLREALSREFIALNKITRDRVEDSAAGPGKPLFWTAEAFGKWLKDNSTRVWAEWNGLLYYRSDLECGRMPESFAEFSHVPEK